MIAITGQKTMLIVDDVELNRAILCELFQQNYAILEAENGQSALEQIEKRKDSITVILLDVVMPIMNGIEVLRELGKSRLLEKIPVILITAESSESTALEGYTIGAADIINKPFSPEIVRRRVHNIVELYEHKRHIERTLQKQYEMLELQSQKLKEANAFVIDTLSTVIEFRNGESGLHIRKMREITGILLRALSTRYAEYRLSDEEIRVIMDAAALHDIGKIAIPDAVLLKPGRLTPEEFEIMKSHTTRGCEILKNINHVHDREMYRYCYDICRHHHERWDGGGYPDGLKETEIPIWSQVVSLADVYEALTSERVYKPRYDHDRAVEMILNGECGAFNPQLLRCFIEEAALLRRIPEQNLESASYELPLEPPSGEAEKLVSGRTLHLLELEREKYRVLSDLSDEITFDYDVQKDVLQFSDKFRSVFGGNFQITDALHTLKESMKILEEDRQTLWTRLAALAPYRNECRMQLRLQTLSGEYEWFEVRIRSLWKWEKHQECISLIGKMTNIHAAKMENVRLREQANTDFLTGMYNRHAIMELICAQGDPGQMGIGTLYFIDVDGFKEINDTHGHLYGDEVLRRVGSKLHSLFRKSDVVGRIGGDEFVVFLREETDLEPVKRKAHEICEMFHELSAEMNYEKGLSGSIGIASCPTDGTDYVVVLGKADHALYHAKNLGKNQYALYCEDMVSSQFQSELSDVDY